MTIVNSESFEFLVVDSDTQIGTALVGLLSTRDIGFRILNIQSQQDLSDCCKQIAAAPEHYVINCLFEKGGLNDLGGYASWGQVAAEIAQAVSKTDKRLIQMSNAVVFSGKSTRAYVETDVPDAISELGLAYIESETAALNASEAAIVIRTSWVFSNLPGNVLTRLVDAAIRSESLVFSGKLMGCPTDANTVARVIVAIVEQLSCDLTSPPLQGVFHYADSDCCSMHTFAKAVITAVKSLTEVRVESISEGDVMTSEDAISDTENYELSCKRILSTFGIKQRPWRRGIQEVLKSKF